MSKNPFNSSNITPKTKPAAESGRRASKPKGKAFFGSQTGNIFGSSRLDVPEHYLKEAAEMSCECRWISAKELKENHGSHPRGWVAWKFKSKSEDGILDSSRFAYGAGDSDGVVRRADLVLAVRPISLGDQHREALAEKRSIYNRFGATKRKEYKDFVRSNMGKDATALEGYDEKD